MDKDLLGEFEDMRTNSISSLSKAKENGKKVAGMYCLYSPTEIVLAAVASAIAD